MQINRKKHIKAVNIAFLQQKNIPNKKIDVTVCSTNEDQLNFKV